MNYDCLQAVLAVYRTGSFSNAAYELYLSQSSVSKNVAKAEKELQVKLFERSGNRVIPTLAGKSLMGAIENAVKSYDELMKEVTCYTRRGGKTLVISTTPLTGLQLTQMFRKCAEAFPAPQLQINENTNRRSLMGLENGQVDLAITVQTYMDGKPCGPFSISTDPRFRLQPIFRDSYFAVVPSNHPFARLEQVGLEEFRDESFITVDETFDSYHAMIEKAFAPLGFRPKIALSASTISAVLDMVEAGMGVSILTKRVAQGKKGVVLVPLVQDLRRETALVCIDHKPLPGILRWLMDYARKQFEEPPAT